MFFKATKFNNGGSSSINDWDLSSLTNLVYMFCDAISFNQPIGNWNVSKATSFSNLFFGARTFDQNINAWNTQNVTDFSFTFKNVNNFNQPLDNWNTSNVVNMSGMFDGALNFNQPIGSWNTSKVVTMNNMFRSALEFNQSLNTWDVSNVKNFERMFMITNNFNQDLSEWNVSNAINLELMFHYSRSFNQNLGTWVFLPNAIIDNMLGSSGIKCKVYSATLIGWSNNPLMPNNKKLISTNMVYDQSAVDARNILVNNKGWIIQNDNYVDSFFCEKNFSSVSTSNSQIISIYPNPGSETFSISSTNDIDKVSIYDSMGKLVLESNEKSFSISHLIQGIYLVQIITERKVNKIHFIKQ
jgi:surface protein